MEIVGDWLRQNRSLDCNDLSQLHDKEVAVRIGSELLPIINEQVVVLMPSIRDRVPS